MSICEQIENNPSIFRLFILSKHDDIHGAETWFLWLVFSWKDTDNQCNLYQVTIVRVRRSTMNPRVKIPDEAPMNPWYLSAFERRSKKIYKPARTKWYLVHRHDYSANSSRNHQQTLVFHRRKSPQLSESFLPGPTASARREDVCRQAITVLFPRFFVRHDVVHKPPYDGLFRVITKCTKTFTISRSGKADTASINRIKPAYLFENEIPTLTIIFLAIPIHESHSTKHNTSPMMPHDVPSPGTEATSTATAAGLMNSRHFVFLVWHISIFVFLHIIRTVLTLALTLKSYNYPLTRQTLHDLKPFATIVA